MTCLFHPFKINTLSFCDAYFYSPFWGSTRQRWVVNFGHICPLHGSKVHMETLLDNANPFKSPHSLFADIEALTHAPVSA